jgi:hypothetical protein
VIKLIIINKLGQPKEKMELTLGWTSDKKFILGDEDDTEQKRF